MVFMALREWALIPSPLAPPLPPLPPVPERCAEIKELPARGKAGREHLNESEGQVRWMQTNPLLLQLSAGICLNWSWALLPLLILLCCPWIPSVLLIGTACTNIGHLGLFRTKCYMLLLLPLSRPPQPPILPPTIFLK